jgi:hypothetical protein
LQRFETTLWAQDLYNDYLEGVVCFGVYLVAQRFLLKFFTIQGSKPRFPDDGCRFLRLVRSGRLRTELEVYSEFYFNESLIRTQLQAEDLDTDPLDEQYDYSELLDVQLASGHLILKIATYTRAGTSRTILAPLPYVVTK